MFYEILKGLHNIIRWVVVLGGLYALVLTLQGFFTRTAWTATVQRAGLIFTSALNIQLVLGILLYFVSPYIQGLMTGMRADMGAIMGDRQSRFFAIEHWFTMILALIIAQVGYSLSKRAKDDRTKYVRSSVAYVLAALLIAYGIPWWRPLFPGL
jgi:hypothetical protein